MLIRLWGCEFNFFNATFILSLHAHSQFPFRPSPQTPSCNIAAIRNIKDGAQAHFKISFVIKLSCPPNKDTNAP